MLVYELRKAVCLGICVAVASLGAEAVARSVTFGHDWVRSHPFSISAVALRPANPSDADFSLESYSGAGMNSILMWKPRQSIIDAAVESNFPVLMNNRAFRIRRDIQEGIDFALTYEPQIPGIEGWLVGEEPGIQNFEAVHELVEWTRTQYPDDLVFSVMGKNGKERWYVDPFVSVIQPDILSYNVYPFRVGETFEIFEGMAYVRGKAMEANIPYWAFIQSYGEPMYRSGAQRIPGESEMRMQVFAHLAMGYTGIQYFTYDDAVGFAMVDPQNNRSPLYDHVQRINHEVANIGQSLTLFESTEVRFRPGTSLSLVGQQPEDHDVPRGLKAWDTTTADPYMTSVSATFDGSRRVLAGDLLIGQF